MSTDDAPVDICVFQLLQVVPQQCVLGFYAVGIVVDNALCLVAGELYDLSVARYIGDLQIKGQYMWLW